MKTIFLAFQLIILIIFIPSCKKKANITNSTINSDSTIVFMLKEEFKDTIKLPFIKMVKYGPILTYIDIEKPLIEETIIDNNSEDIKNKSINNLNKIIVKFIYRLDEVYFYVNKGDSVIYNKGDKFPYFTLNSNNNFDLKYEYLKRKYFNNYDSNDFNYFIFKKVQNSKNIEKVKINESNKRLSLLNKESSFLDSLFNKDKISKDFYTLQKSKIKFDYHNFNLDVFGYNYYKENQIKFDLDMNNTSLIPFNFYKNFIKKNILFKYYKENINKADYVSLLNFVLISDLNDNIKKLLYFEYLKIIFENDSKEIALKYFYLFEKKYNDKNILSYFKNKYSVYFLSSNIKINNVKVIDKDKNEINFDAKISNHKIIYMDFWASWCAPCRAAMPASKKLHKKYKNKDIEFVYVSIDKNFESWQKASKKEELVEKNSFLAVNYPEATFYKENQLKSIPRYMIYHKGKLVNNNAPAPDSPEIIKELDKYLAEE